MSYKKKRTDSESLLGWRIPHEDLWIIEWITKSAGRCKYMKWVCQMVRVNIELLRVVVGEQSKKRKSDSNTEIKEWKF